MSPNQQKLAAAPDPSSLVEDVVGNPVDVLRSYIWPLFPKSQLAADGPMILSSGEGSRVKDTSGASYLDLSSSVSRASALGYGNEEIAEAVYRQLQRLHYAGQGEFQADVVFRLAAKLAELTPGELGATYFTESGTAANEVAFKLSRLYHRAVGRKPRAYKIISRWNGYHGAIGGPMAASDWLGVRHPAEPGTPGVSLIPAPTCYRSQLGPGYPLDSSMYVDFLEQQILHEGPELVAAFIAEPVMQGNGVQIPPADYFPRVREICDRYDVLLIADEVITGFGRTGRWFGIENWGVNPDIITMAKGITAGYMPLGATIVRQDIWDALPVFNDVHTYGGHPAAAAASLAMIGLYEREGIIDRARETGKHMLDSLRRLERYDVVGEVRGLGMWAAVDFTADEATRAPLPLEDVRRILLAARAHGLILTSNGSAVELAPRLDIPREEIDEGISLLELAIREFEQADR
jgi:adenosylmethionine-8-amino-7-oxononanoate aminotransferase